MDRRSTFINKEIVDKLKANFVLVAGDCKDWQKGHSETQRWFMSVVSSSHDPVLKNQLRRLPNGEGDTAQGFYVVGADGKLYGWNNSHYGPETVNLLDSSLQAYRRSPQNPILLTEEQISDPFCCTPDSSTSIVQVFTRITPVPTDCDDLNHGVGRDYMWVYADDVRSILSDSAQHADRFSLPKNLVARLVRFHLVDNVRGEPDEWKSQDIKLANFTVKLIAEDAIAKHFQFEGEYRQETENHCRGQQGTLFGRFDIALGSGKIENLRAYGEAQAWGESRFTPGAPKGKFGLVTAMISADDSYARTIAPHAIYGDDEEYHVPDLALWHDR